MATPDVSVHVEEVVVVTTPDNIMDGSGVEGVKAVLVTTNRSFAEEAMESENMAAAAAAAFSASTELKEAVLVKMEDGDGEEETMEAEIAYPITCGESKANLIWRKFVCPGINVKCVQYNEHLISPKEFVHLAGKSTLKDWKRAIRMNGVMLRKIMDSGELDFYQHSKVCSNTCRSTKIDVTGGRMSLCSQVSTEYIPITTTSSDNFTVNGNPTTITIETCDSSGEWSNVGDDTLIFWQGLRDAGLLGDIIQEFHQELLETMKGLKERLQTPLFELQDAVLLNNIVQNFGMLDLIKKVLASHKSQMDRSREQYTRDLAALEQQCDEHRRRAKELKHKSQHLNNVLMTLTPVTLPPAAKRPRLTRATSGPAAIGSQVSSQQTQITLPQGMSLSQLTSLPFSKILSTGIPVSSCSSVINKNSYSQANSPSSPVLGGYTILAPSGSNFPSTLEIHPDSSNLTVLSTAAMQDSNTVLKVVSPIQLLTLQGLGATIQNLAQLAPAGSTIVAMPCESGEGEEEHTTIEVTSLSEEQEQK
ncbi:glucocorticoid modulatory element-binding protein 2 isoform X4 [Pseudophryne corroboree]|uniref:glucocorticoid modulatory element-binding protein 2 isoform X4 n=1 Tax=Pseudophryne corroboree TaxID=495146 RepID=UPI003081A893